MFYYFSQEDLRVLRRAYGLAPYEPLDELTTIPYNTTYAKTKIHADGNTLYPSGEDPNIFPEAIYGSLADKRSHEPMSLIGIISCHDGALIFSDSQSTLISEGKITDRVFDEPKLFATGDNKVICVVGNNRFNGKRLDEFVPEIFSQSGQKTLARFAEYALETLPPISTQLLLVELDVSTFRTAITELNYENGLIRMERNVLFPRNIVVEGPQWARSCAYEYFSQTSPTYTVDAAAEYAVALAKWVGEVERAMPKNSQTIGGYVNTATIKCVCAGGKAETAIAIERKTNTI